MENKEQNGNGNPRMDRMENMMEMLIADHVKFAEEHNKLLTSQILLTGSLQGLTESVKELREAQKETDGRITILVGMMDNFIRERGEA